MSHIINSGGSAARLTQHLTELPQMGYDFFFFNFTRAATSQTAYLSITYGETTLIDRGGSESTCAAESFGRRLFCGV